MGDVSQGQLIKNLHIERYWRSFDENERKQCIKAGAADGVVLKHSLDRSLGNVYKIIPEINLRDLTTRESNSFLALFAHRATNTLLDQYSTGLNGRPGDHDFIKHMMDTRTLGLPNPDRNGLTLFYDEDRYGESMTIMRNASEVFAGLSSAIQANLCVPQERGELILQRQLYMLQSLNIIIEDILYIGSRTRDRKKLPQKSGKSTVSALSKLSIQEPAKPPSLPEIINNAADQRARLQEYLTLLSTEPVVLTHDVNICFFSRPELLPDERGRILPVHTDKYISGAVLEVVYNSVKAVAIWDYIGRLLALLESQPSTNKICRAVILQELSSVCHLEYGRVQALFRRNVQTASSIK
ncbi:hypothetical protein LTR84_005714 [Exophiala bonariae]|uniref:Uncharacterized protein n=1 Tax=Exophiala bonariae TaxID=1690606 RepID=A0AAV9N7C8_9EURO|nr:hypothetical protein LTR84_005714 [Exophiala bonariae]